MTYIYWAMVIVGFFGAGYFGAAIIRRIIKDRGSLMKCEKCKHPADKLTEVLCTGDRGYRKYRLCDKCAKAQKDSEKREEK